MNELFDFIDGDGLNIGQKLKKYREDRKISIEDISYIIDEDPETVMLFESGDRLLPFDSMLKVFVLMDMPTQLILKTNSVSNSFYTCNALL